MKKSLKIIGALILVSTLAIGCKKYDNGGSIRKAEDNLTGSVWKLDQYLRNGTTETDQLLLTNYAEDYQSGGTLVRTYNDASGDPQSQTGTWAFDSDKQKVSLSGVGSIELTAQTSTVSTSSYDILKLTKDELWYSYANGGDTHEFHLIPQ